MVILLYNGGNLHEWPEATLQAVALCNCAIYIHHVLSHVYKRCCHKLKVIPLILGASCTKIKKIKGVRRINVVKGRLLISEMCHTNLCHVYWLKLDHQK